MSRQDFIEAFHLGFALGKIAQVVDEETLKEIDKDLQAIEENVLKLVAEERE